MRVCVTRGVDIPDPRRLEQYRRTPELGPAVLFFSGGTALRDTAKQLITHTPNSLRLITPFDSGGSSAVLRKAFAMPAVGDIRNRLMALADQSVKGNPAIFELFAHRLPKTMSGRELHAELDALCTGRHPLIRSVPDPMRKIIRTHFEQFRDQMPGDFDLRGASLGNLVLTGGYLSNRRQLDPVIFLFSKLVQVCGVVRPTVNKDLHLAVRLDDGRVIVGQHLITGKETEPLSSPIREIWLTASPDSEEPVRSAIQGKIAERIAEADLIVYPPGSFFTSVIANLLPDGVGRAVVDNSCPKVFVPNTSADPETTGMSVTDQVDRLRRHLLDSGAPEGGDVLGYVVVDRKNGEYPGGLNCGELEQRGLTVIDAHLATRDSAPYIDALKLCEILLSLC